MPIINGERLLSDLKRLRAFGAHENGVVRQSLTPVDLESRAWLVGRLTEAGLDARIDGLGNVIGRSKNPGPALLIGSHTDTQPTGGWLDGAMGVMYGLEVARALSEDATTRDAAVDVASWIDEEGTYIGFLGSRSYCGELDDTEVESSVSRAGQRLVDALRAAGFADNEREVFEAGRYRGYLEAHIEQGPFLEAKSKRIGVVTSIIGMRDFDVVFEGQQNHAGTTPMNLRRDAGAAAIEFAHRVTKAYREIAHESTVYTIGKVEFHPGAPSIIPGRASMILQFRDADDALLDDMEQRTLRVLSEVEEATGVRTRIAHRSNDAVSAKMDETLQASIARAAERHAPGHWVHMPSGAAHDAQILANVMPAGMLFVPSIGGVSHDFSEDTDEDDIVLGCQVLASACADILLGK